MPNHLAHLLNVMVSKDLAVYEPTKQTRATLLYWRLPEEWAEALHEWVCALFWVSIALLTQVNPLPMFAPTR